MARVSKLDQLSDKVINALLKRYACPMPFHAVRALFMGNIATPDLHASPVQAIRDLWGGELPEFETEQDAKLFMTALMQGLWGGMSNHQKRTNPFKLIRVKTDQPDWETLARFTLIRREELDGFLEGLFAGHDELDLPEKAHMATNVLGEIRGLIAGVHELAITQAKPTDVSELDDLIKQIRELSIIVAKEINVVVQSCQRARAQALETHAAPKPVLH
tara:strand:+ start:317 stop:970 length:654 start_codon:yes stop_codon:yes gene_type:complete